MRRALTDTGTVTIDLDGSYSGVGAFALGTLAGFPGSTVITTTAPCFAAGTRILTPHGEVPVERLAPGMQVRLFDGETAEVVWTGHRRVLCDRHPDPDRVWPVRIRAGALDTNIPARDLFVSPDHAILVEGVLVPAGLLIDGEEIVQQLCETVTYHHVELDRHAIVVAEGAPAECYLDTGNRRRFANAPLVDFAPDFGSAAHAQGLCAELVLEPSQVKALRDGLAAKRRLDTPPEVLPLRLARSS